ncbi:hypothetical protein [Nitratireductor rhodophyticola]|uniref:hypothetical protein n=1 Tax=Nitratireductor rhodophyticola TaxID=2854036 RepID=UPI003BA9C4EA
MKKRRPDIRVVPASAEHIGTIAKRMRRQDRDEVMAASGKMPREALEFSLLKSTIAYTGTVDGRPEVMFGAGDINILNGIAAPWLLGTKAVERHHVAFLRHSVEWRDQLLRRYSILRNFVDDRNHVSIRWLRWLGFTLSDPVMMNGHAFRLFELRSTDVRFDHGAHSRLNPSGGGRTGAAGAGAGKRV